MFSGIPEVHIVGERVPFVIIRGRTSRRNKELFVDRAEDPQHVLEKNIPLDTEYYIEKQILPPVLKNIRGLRGNQGYTLSGMPPEQSANVPRRC